MKCRKIHIYFIVFYMIFKSRLRAFSKLMLGPVPESEISFTAQVQLVPGQEVAFIKLDLPFEFALLDILNYYSRDSLNLRIWKNDLAVLTKSPSSVYYDCQLLLEQNSSLLGSSMPFIEVASSDPNHPRLANAILSIHPSCSIQPVKDSLFQQNTSTIDTNNTTINSAAGSNSSAPVPKNSFEVRIRILKDWELFFEKNVFERMGEFVAYLGMLLLILFVLNQKFVRFCDKYRIN